MPNDNHDDHGRFASGSGGGGTSKAAALKAALDASFRQANTNANARDQRIARQMDANHADHHASVPRMTGPKDNTVLTKTAAGRLQAQGGFKPNLRK